MRHWNAVGAALLVLTCPSFSSAQSVILSEPTRTILTVRSDTEGRLALTASVTTEQGAGVPGGTIRFIDESRLKVLGWAGVSTSRIVIDRLDPGLHRLRADYSGTADFLPLMVQPSQSATRLQHVRAKSAVTVWSSTNPSVPGQIVTLLAAVTTADAPPMGSVTFRDGAEVLAAHVGLDRAGSASFTTSALADGPRAIVVDYEGDGVHAPASSARLLQDVGHPLQKAEAR